MYQKCHKSDFFGVELITAVCTINSFQPSLFLKKVLELPKFRVCLNLWILSAESLYSASWIGYLSMYIFTFLVVTDSADRTSKYYQQNMSFLPAESLNTAAIFNFCRLYFEYICTPACRQNLLILLLSSISNIYIYNCIFRVVTDSAAESHNSADRIYRFCRQNQQIGLAEVQHSASRISKFCG